MTTAKLLFFSGLFWATSSERADSASPMMLSQYDQLKVVNSAGRLDCPRLVSILTEMSTTTFNFLLWGSDGTQYLDFVACLQHTQGLVINGHPFQAWLTLMPPSEAASSRGCSIPADSPLTPFNELSYFNSSLGLQGCLDFVGWSTVLGLLGQQFPHLTHLNVDDFVENPNTFTSPLLQQMLPLLHKGDVALVPTAYYRLVHFDANTVQAMVDGVDGFLYYFRNDKQGLGPCSDASCGVPNATLCRSCVAGACAEATVGNLGDELADVRALMPSNKPLYVGFYATGLNNCGSPSPTYTRLMLEESLKWGRSGLLGVNGVNVYTLRSPPAPNACSVGNATQLDAGCAVQWVFSHYSGTCPSSTPFLYGSGGGGGADTGTAPSYCCSTTIGLPGACQGGGQCCLTPGASGCAPGVPKCY